MREIAFVLIFMAGAFAQQVRIERDLVYARAGQRELRLDLHIPQAASPLPVAVAIHGGGWQSGSKENAPGRFLPERWSRSFASAGLDASLYQRARLSF